MKGSTRIIKGRIEEAVGALTDNDKLRAKGRIDQTVGYIKQAAERGVRQVKDSARKIVDKTLDIA